MLGEGSLSHGRGYQHWTVSSVCQMGGVEKTSPQRPEEGQGSVSSQELTGVGPKWGEWPL